MKLGGNDIATDVFHPKNEKDTKNRGNGKWCQSSLVIKVHVFLPSNLH